MPVEPAAVELLSDLSNVLNDWGRWYVFEAQAVTAYGLGHELDADRMRGTLGRLEEALSQSDLLPSFDAIRRDDASDTEIS